jgi:glycosyltransferase involved in cell wall biosynthesis
VGKDSPTIPSAVMKVRVGQYGARMYYGIPQALHSLDYLEKLYTDFTVNKGLPRQLINFPRFSKLKNRHANGLPPGKIVHLPDYGLRHFLRMKKAKNEQAVNEANFQHGVYLEKQMMRDGLRGIDALCMIGSPSEMIFRKAREKKITTIMEQIIAPAATYLHILDTYLKPYQDWEDINASITSIRYWENVSQKEWAQSDYVLSGSDFVRDSAKECGLDPEKIVTIPYGVPALLQPSDAARKFSVDRKLRVLFVGLVGVRKGVQYLLEIAKNVKHFCEIKICGTIAIKKEIVQKFKDDVSFIGHVSREDIGRYYEWADIFVLPTLFEGSATVCYEAIQHGLPIITTKNAGLFLKHGEGATIIPLGDSSSLEKALRDFYENPEKIKEQSTIVRSHIQFASMAGYQSRLQAFFKNLAYSKHL